MALTPIFDPTGLIFPFFFLAGQPNERGEGGKREKREKRGEKKGEKRERRGASRLSLGASLKVLTKTPAAPDGPVLRLKGGEKGEEEGILRLSWAGLRGS